MWTDFFIAAASASAALAGLVFVALSVNITHILRFPNLPSRAAATIGSLILILVASMAALVDQPARALGIEILIFGLCASWLQLVSARLGFAVSPLRRPVREAVLNAVLGAVQVIPFILAGVLLVAGHLSGLYVAAAGCIATLIFSVLNAWVLLVEILR
jgi:modulator of FtsH protease